MTTAVRMRMIQTMNENLKKDNGGKQRKDKLELYDVCVWMSALDLVPRRLHVVFFSHMHVHVKEICTK